MESYNKETRSAIDNAVSSLRKQIIASITKDPADKYELAQLLWGAAAQCFPDGGWDGAWFNLDLKTCKISASVSTYPNQFGACCQGSISLSAREFNRIAKQFNMSKELQAFESDEDWAKLFDDSLKAAVSSACAILQKRDEERKREEIKKYAIKIPAEYLNKFPDMGLSEITIKISQAYAVRNINVTNEKGKYQLVSEYGSLLSPEYNRYPRELSFAEAVWLEKQVEAAIYDPDASTWQSLRGGDTMDIVIKRNKGSDISLRDVKPIKKYSNLQDELGKLAKYGSIILPGKQAEVPANHPDASTCRSRPGGDTMNTVIREHKDSSGSLRATEPVRTESDRQDELASPAKHGSTVDNRAPQGRSWEGEALYLTDSGGSAFGKLCLSASSFTFRKPGDEESRPFLRGDISAAAGAIAVTDSKVTLKCSKGTLQFGLFPSAANSLREWVENKAKEAVRTPPAPIKKEIPIPKSVPSNMVERLSDLCAKAFSYKKDSTFSQYSDNIKQLGAKFFENDECIMAYETGNKSELRSLAITRFARLLGSFAFVRLPFFENATCEENGHIRYHAYSNYVPGGYCYDGGCYSEEPEYTDHYYFHLRRITSEQYNAQKEKRMKLRKDSFTIWCYQENLPYTDQTEVFVVDHVYLYLKDPMGIVGYYEIERECR